MNIEIKGISRTIHQFLDYDEAVEDGVARVVAESTVSIEGNAKSLAPVDQGNLKRSIGHRFKDRGFTGEVFAGANYAPYVEFPTKPHEIRVKKARVLSDGKNIFGKKVQHPGTKAQPFMRPSVERERPIFHDNLTRELRKFR